MLHGDEQFRTYSLIFNFISDALSSDVMNTKLRQLDEIVTGSDEEKAMVNALQRAFLKSQHLFCMLHCKDNVRFHLTKVGVATEQRERVLQLLFGTDGCVFAGDEITLQSRTGEVIKYV